jgi:hypothetical protein
MSRRRLKRPGVSEFQNREGFGWMRWSRQRRNAGPQGSPSSVESRTSRIGRINLDAKQTGERKAGKPPIAFDVAGTGNVSMVEML